jgi:hypothetical protein
MGYYLMIFDPERVPTKKNEFDNWFQSQMNWKSDYDYNNPSNLNAKLNLFFKDFISKFPPMNGPLAVDDENIDDYTTDYSLSSDFIYASFAWSVEIEAYNLAKELSKKFGLGIYDCDYKYGIELSENKKPFWKFW